MDQPDTHDKWRLTRLAGMAERTLILVKPDGVARGRSAR